MDNETEQKCNFDERLQLNNIRELWARFLSENNIVADLDIDGRGIVLQQGSDTDPDAVVVLLVHLELED